MGLALRLALIAWIVLTPVMAAAACPFDADRLTFTGDDRRQAACLLRAPGPGGVLAQAPAKVPRALARRLGRPAHIDPRVLTRALTAAKAPADMILHIGDPVSRARDNDTASPQARYFVIHDTSQPYFGAAPFPGDIDTSDAVNDLSAYQGADAVAHLFINRRGQMMVGHDLSVPWRATKFESRVIGLPAKGLFLHMENQQPRRADPAGPPGNDRIAPKPGLTESQYDALALAYVVASARAGRWLIPAFHADIDEGLPDAHDDPQNFDLDAFDAAVTRTISALKPRAGPRSRLRASAPDGS